jgi:lauroyl/myristoyl acyltransferase
MDFLGHKTMIPKGAAYFSIKTGAPIVPIFFIRRDDDHFEINAYPPIDPPRLADGKITDTIAREYIQQYLTAIEDQIRKNPSQWLLFREFGQT